MNRMRHIRAFESAGEFLFKQVPNAEWGKNAPVRHEPTRLIMGLVSRYKAHTVWGQRKSDPISGSHAEKYIDAAMSELGIGLGDLSSVTAVVSRPDDPDERFMITDQIAGISTPSMVGVISKGTLETHMLSLEWAGNHLRMLFMPDDWVLVYIICIIKDVEVAGGGIHNIGTVIVVRCDGMDGVRQFLGGLRGYAAGDPSPISPDEFHRWEATSTKTQKK